MAHACELETSLYLAIRPDLVRMERAVREIPEWDSDHAWMDWSDGPLAVMPWWNAISHTGVHGDATKATAEKGLLLFEAAVHGMIELVDELRAWPIEKRQDMHQRPVQSEIRW